MKKELSIILGIAEQGKKDFEKVLGREISWDEDMGEMLEELEMKGLDNE